MKKFGCGESSSFSSQGGFANTKTLLLIGCVFGVVALLPRIFPDTGSPEEREASRLFSSGGGKPSHQLGESRRRSSGRATASVDSLKSSGRALSSSNRLSDYVARRDPSRGQSLSNDGGIAGGAVRDSKPYIALEALAYKRRSGSSSARGVRDSGHGFDEPMAELPDGSLSISGRVFNEQGQPLGGIEVVAKVNRLFNAADQGLSQTMVGGQRRAYSGPDGSFAFQQLAAGEYQLNTAATRRYPSANIVVRTGADNARLVLRETQRPLVIYGQIKSADGRQLAGVHIVPSTRPSDAATSDQSGDYQLDLMLSSRDKIVTLRLEAPHFKKLTVRLNRADFEGVEALRRDLTMEPIGALATVSGRVLTSAGEAVAEETLALYSPSIARHYRATSDASGRFSIADVPVSNDYRLSIKPKGPYQDYFRNRLQITANGLTLDVVLRPLAMSALSGQMVDVVGRPIPNFTLWLRSRTVSQLRPVEVTSNAGGYFQVDEIPQGEVTLRTMSSPVFSVTGVRLAPGEEQYANLVLDWGKFQLRGRVVDRMGRPVPVPEIRLSWSHLENGVNSLSIRTTAAASDGRFQFSSLGPGRHVLSVDTPGFKKFQLDCEVGSAGANPVELRLEESTP